MRDILLQVERNGPWRIGRRVGMDDKREDE